MEIGIRTINIAGLTRDSIKEKQAQRDIIKNLTRKWIHFAEIRETQIIQDIAYTLGNYREITSERGME